MMHQSYPSRFFLLPCLLLVFLTPGEMLRSQESDNLQWWANAGFGANSMGSVAASASLSMSMGHHLITLRATDNTEGLFGDDFWDAAAVYGYAATSSSWLYSVAGGVAIVKGSDGDGFLVSGKPVGPVVGLAVDGQIFHRPLRWLGVGLHAYADINSLRSFFGATFSLQFGHLY